MSICLSSLSSQPMIPTAAQIQTASIPSTPILFCPPHSRRHQIVESRRLSYRLHITSFLLSHSILTPCANPFFAPSSPQRGRCVHEQNTSLEITTTTTTTPSTLTLLHLLNRLLHTSVLSMKAHSPS